MLTGLKKQWKHLTADPPGKRFQLRYERRKRYRRTPLARVMWTALAIFLILLGLVFIPMPGPGIVVMIFGCALLAEESLYVAKFCDAVEVAIRRLIPGGRAMPAKPRRR
jgi:hypothetical protein